MTITSFNVFFSSVYNFWISGNAVSQSLDWAHRFGGRVVDMVGQIFGVRRSRFSLQSHVISFTGGSGFLRGTCWYEVYLSQGGYALVGDVESTHSVAAPAAAALTGGKRKPQSSFDG